MAQDPTAPIVMTAADVEPSKVSQLSTLNSALATQQTADRAAGKAVTKPAGYRIATDQERADCIALAKRLARENRWTGKLDPIEYQFTRKVETTENDADGKPQPVVKDVVTKIVGLDAQCTFGHWWVKP